MLQRKRSNSIELGNSYNIILPYYSVKPQNPSKVQVLNQLKDTVTLGWSRPSSDGGDKIQGYIIEYKKVGDGHWEKYNTKPIEDVQGKGMV